LMSDVIKSAAAETKDYKGFKGHQVQVTPQMKVEMRAVCESPEFSDHTDFIRNFCRTIMREDRHKFILATLTDGDFGSEHLIARTNSVCMQMLKVCPVQKLVFSPTDCHACAETFMDLEYLLRRDRQDLTKSGFGMRKKWNARESPMSFRSRQHVSARLSELCESIFERHVLRGGSEEIQQVCEAVVEEYESEIITTFAGGKVLGYGAAPQRICVEISGRCTTDEFLAALPLVQSYHLSTFPQTRETKADVPKEMPGVRKDEL